MQTADPCTVALGPDRVNAEGVILALCYVLLGDGTKKDRGLLNLMIDGRQHVPNCPRGQWINPNSPRPDGDPCSDRCVRAHAILNSAEVWLRDHDAPAPPPAAVGGLP